MACYGSTPPSGQMLKGAKRTKKKKDPNAPKRSMSAFFWYSQDERPKVRAANPEYNVGDVAKELGRRWSDAGPELKSKYEALAEKDRARYGNAKREYQISLKNGNARTVVTKNGDRGSGGEESLSPKKVLNAYPSQEAQNMQETILENSLLAHSENNPDDNSSFENTHNDSSITNKEGNHQSSATANESQSIDDVTNKASNNTNENGDVPHEEEEDLDEESE